MASQEIRELTRAVPFELNGHADTGMAFTVLHWLGAAGHSAPAYWSTSRDIWLRQFYLRSDYLKIATRTFVQKAYATPLKISARDHSVKAHVELAHQMHDDLMRNSGLLRGFLSEFSKFATDYVTQDNGAFLLVMGPGKPDGPITGQAVGVLHLDSQQCIRTGDVEFPVIYHHRDGKRYKLHFTRCLYMSSLPSADADLYDVGLCAVSACMDSAQDMLDISTYNAEKLGSRPPRQILYAKTGATLKQLSEAALLANTKMDAQGLDRFARTMMLAPASPTGQLDLGQIDLAKTPDGFDRQQAVILDVAVIAAAYGLDMRDLAHSFGVAGQTKADAEVMHMKTNDKGVMRFLDDCAEQLNQKLLPDTLEAYFDYVDDTQDEQAATIRKLRAEGRTLDLTAGTMTVRVAREQMLEDGEITEQQFEAMELAEGRLVDGLDVLMLFQSQDREISAILLGIDPGSTGSPSGTDPALIEERRRMAWQRHDNAPNANIKRKMRQALAALDKVQATPSEPKTPPADAPPAQDGEQPAADDSEPVPATKQLHTKQDEDLDSLMSEYDGELADLVESARTGKISQSDFEDETKAIVAALLLAAFLRGSRFSEAELTKAMRDRLGEQVDINLDAVTGFADDIYAGRYAPEELGEEGASHRTAMWVGGLVGIYALGQMHRRDNPRFAWRMGATKEHCDTCQRLSGQVHTAEEWMTSGYYPRSFSLDCHGFRCLCYFEEVSSPSHGGF